VQDGGVGKFNNPVESSHWEGKAIWGVKPELILSIGTGFLEKQMSISNSATRHRIWDSFPFRLVRSLRATNCGQNTWLDYWNRLDENERKNSFRIDLPLDQAFELDDVSYLDRLRSSSKELLRGFDFDQIELALLSANFFFELDSIPVWKRNIYECTGFIYCRSPDRAKFIAGMMQKFPLAYFSDNT
jgi:hypothetical protein